MAKAQDEYIIKFGIEGANELSKLQVKLAQANKKLSDFNKKVKEQNGVSGSAVQQNKKLRKTIDNLKKSIELQSSALNKNTKQSKLLSKAKGLLGSKLVSNISKFSKFAVAATVVIAAMRKLIRFISETVKSFAEFEKGIINVTTLLGERETDLFSGQLFKGAISLAQNYGFALKDVSKAMFDSVSAGISAGEAIEFLDEAATLAVAGATDLKSATLGLTTVINAYGLETREAADVAATLFNTQKFGVLTVEELSKSLGVVVPFAAASGVSLKELGAAMAVTTRTGLDAAKTVTALRAAISQMQKPAAESRDLFIKYGIPIGSAQLKAVGFTETMRRLNVAFKDSPAAIEKMFGNVRGLTAIFSIAGDNAEDYDRILERLEDTSESFGNIEKGKADLLDSTSKRLEKLSQSWETFKVTFGDTSFYRSVISGLTGIVNSLIDVFDGTDQANFDKILDPYRDLLDELSPIGDRYSRSRQKFNKEFESFFHELKDEIKSSSDIPKDYRRMLEVLSAANDEVDLSTIDRDDLDDYQKRLLEMGRLYGELLEREAQQDADAKKAEQDRLDELDKRKQKGIMTFNSFELHQRENLQKEIDKIQAKAIDSGEYANVTQLKVSEQTLATLRQTQQQFLMLGIDDEKKAAEIRMAIAKEILNQKKLNQAIEKQDNQAFDELEIESYTNLAREKRDLTLKEAQDRTMTNKELTRELLKTDIEYYEELLRQADNSEEGFRASGQTKQQLEEKLTNAKIQLLKNEEQEERAKRKRMVDLTKQGVDLLFEHRERMAEIEFQNFERRMEKRKAMIDQELQDGLINERQASSEKNRMEREAFEKRKQYELKLARINLSQELANIAVQAAGNPTNKFTFGAAGAAQYAVLAALAIARYQGNVSAIQAQEFAKGGLVMGNSHAMGGEKFAVGGRVVELEGGEAVINKRSTAMFGDTLSAMNQAGGGTSFRSPNLGGGSIIDYEALGNVIASNTNVVLPVESLNKTQNRVKMIERNAKF